MKLKNQFITINIAIILFLIILGTFIFLMLQNQKDIEKSYELRNKSLLLANELRQSSDKLTRYCRSYILTMDSTWEKMYQDVLAVRNGQNPWANGRKISLQDSIKKIGLTKLEIVKLKEAEQNSNNLVFTEKKAFGAIKGLFADDSGNFDIESEPNQKFAIQIMFNEKYHADKLKIMKPIDDFVTMLDQRTKKSVDGYHKKANWLLGVALSLIVLLVGITVIAFFIIKNNIIKQIEELSLTKLKTEQSEEQKRKILDTFKDGIYIITPDYKIDYLNSALIKKIGRNAIGETCYKTIYNKNSACDWCVYPKILNQNKDIDYELKTPDDRTLTVHAMLLENKSCQSIINDVTKQKQDELEFKKLWLAIEQSPSTIVITDTAGNIEYANPYFTELTGYSVDEALGKNPRILKTKKTPPETFVNLWKTISSGNVWKGEFVNKKKNGQEFIEKAVIAPIKNDNNEIINYVAIKDDITKLKKAEKELIQREKELSVTNKSLLDERNIFMIGNVVVFKWRNDEGWPVEYVSQNAANIFGYSTDDFINGRISYEELIHKEDFDRVINEVNTAINNNLNFFDHKEYRIVNKSGDEVWLYDFTTILRNENEEVTHLYGYVMNVTDRKNAERALKSSEERLILAQNAGKIGTWEWNIKTDQIIWSDMTYKIFGLTKTKKEITSDEYFSLVHPDDKERLIKELDQSLKRKKKEHNTIYRIVKKGKIRWIDETSIIIMSHDGQLIRMIGVLKDVTLQKLAEQALKDSEERYRAIFSTTLTGIAIIDESGTYISINPSSVNIHGYSQEEVIGKTLSKHLHPDDLDLGKQIISDILSGAKESVSTEIRLKHGKTNEDVWININVTKYPERLENGKKTVLSVFQDITRIKNTEHALEESQDKLKESNKTKDRFFSIIAHDLRGPFSTMIGFSDLLIDNFEDFDSTEQKKYLGVLAQTIQNTHKLLENLLLWSSSQSGTIDFNPQKENLDFLVNESMDIAGQLAANKSIQLHNQISKNIFVEADRNMVLTILRNLISNAIKFTPKDGKVYVSSRMAAKKDEQNYVEVSIRDNGMGIRPKELTNLFKLSKNISTKGTEGESGSGLGLILCQEFIHKHGGKIWAKSEEGNGSTFTFTLKTL